VTRTGEQIGRLQRSIEGLARDVGALRDELAQAPTRELRHALRRRGLVWKKVLHDGCLTPPAAGAQDEFYQLLRHYSFRLFLRDVINRGDRFGLGDLLRYCSRPTARRYLQWLVDHRLVQRRGARCRLVSSAVSFGPTLEWFVAEALRREFGIPAAWNVRFDAAPGGGDFDVIGFQESTCVYIETKSSPPRNINAAQIRAFFDRLDTLRPHVALFLNDTQLRMGDKIALLFTEELRRRLGRRARARRVERLTGELFMVGADLFISNSDPDLVGNIGVCLARYFRDRGYHLRGQA
jgi:hypothetical protein